MYFETLYYTLRMANYTFFYNKNIQKINKVNYEEIGM